MAALEVAVGKVASRAARRVKPRPRRRAKPRTRSASFDRLLAIAALVCGAAVLLVLWHDGRKAPVVKLPLTPDQARAINAATPFVPTLERPQRFVFTGSKAAREQATDCLATAALYEAGADADGQRAVMQVVLNRVQHRGYPKTVCGVVYAGSRRLTGCQFSFTCDGSIARRREHRGWHAARLLARHALTGAVFANVGRSTHYHTDWVVPVWSRTLDKVAQIHSHIFYQPRAPIRIAL